MEDHCGFAVDGVGGAHGQQGEQTGQYNNRDAKDPVALPTQNRRTAANAAGARNSKRPVVALTEQSRRRSGRVDPLLGAVGELLALPDR
jgi:hypothetical protein